VADIVRLLPLMSSLLPPERSRAPFTVSDESITTELPDPTFTVKLLSDWPPVAKDKPLERPPLVLTIRFAVLPPLSDPDPLIGPLIVRLALFMSRVPLLSARVPITSRLPPIDAREPAPTFTVKLSDELPVVKFSVPAKPPVVLIVIFEVEPEVIVPLPEADSAPDIFRLCPFRLRLPLCRDSVPVTDRSPCSESVFPAPALKFKVPRLLPEAIFILAEPDPLALIVSVLCAFVLSEPLPVILPVEEIVKDCPLKSSVLPVPSDSVPFMVSDDPRVTEFPNPTFTLRSFINCPPLAKFKAVERPPMPLMVRFELLLPLSQPVPLRDPPIVRLSSLKFKVPDVS